MSTVTLNGNTYNDTATPPLNMGNGGHRANLLPMLADAVADLAAKAALATTQAGNASTSAGTATTQAGIATTQASNAAASAASAAAIAGAFVGTSATSWTPAIESKAFATQTGEQYTAGIFVTVVSAAAPSAYGFGQVSGYSGSTLTVDVQFAGGSGAHADWNISLAGARGATGATGATTLPLVAYADRATLRALTPVEGDQKLLEALGLFRWYGGSAEPDDDETCFATASGRWMMECPHWDVADAMAGVDESAQDDRDEDSETRLTSAETRWPGRWMFGSANCSITSVTTLAQASFTATITGAAVNDYVIATPPNALEARISVFARVTAADTITVYLNNPSASTATIATGSWEIAIFKEI